MQVFQDPYITHKVAPTSMSRSVVLIGMNRSALNITLEGDLLKVVRHKRSGAK